MSPPWHKNPLAIDYKILRVDEVWTRSSSPVIVLSTEAVIFCGGECQPLIRTLTFKPVTLRQKLQSGALQSWFSSRVTSMSVYMTRSLHDEACEANTAAVHANTRVCEHQKSDYNDTGTRQTNSNTIINAVWIIYHLHTKINTHFVCQWETSSFLLLWIPASWMSDTEFGKQTNNCK